MPDSPSHAFPSLDELAVLLPPYEIQCCIHEGLTSAIYLARQIALERTVMIRIMPEPEAELVPLLLDRLRKRARLVNPKIVSVFDFGRTTAGPLYLVTEYVNGGLLDVLIQENQITPVLAFQLANQLCDTLQMVHDLHIVHGALSPHTVLVTKDWQIKLTGIGMSETADGELSWMEESSATYADDMRALGVVIHAMFCGKLPSDSGRVSSSLPPAFAKVVERCLTEDLTRRYQQPNEVRAALAEALRAEKAAPAPPRRTVVSAAPPGSAAVAAQPAAPAPRAPPKAVPGRPPPRMAPPPPPSFYQRLDAFFWSTIRTSLHLLIIGGTIILLATLVLFKDRLVLENPDDAAPSASTSPAPTPEDSGPKKQSAPATPRPPPKPLTPKDAKYRTVLQREIATARDEKRTDDLTALRKEIQRVQNGRGVPAKDEDDLPALLKRLREDYRNSPPE